MSGNSYQKIALWAQFLGLQLPGRTTFDPIQTKCVVPEVESYWIHIRDSYLEALRGTEVVVEGRNWYINTIYCNDVYNRKSFKMVFNF